MVIDSSALLAILFGEADRDKYIHRIEVARIRLMSAANALETAVVVESRKGRPGGREFDLLMHTAGIDVVPMTPEHFEVARRVWREFGKGNHPAGLNFCDCCALALSRISGYPLLFKGGDFPRSNAVSALA